MVTPDVPEGIRAPLRLAFDRVVEVPYIEQRSRPLPSAKQRERYGPWADRGPTKWNCLGLAEYDRVAFVDADIVFIANVDDLFELRPPAACFSLPWARPWQRDGSGVPNPYLACVPGAEALGDLPHGARIPAATILGALHTASFVGGGFLLVLAPGGAALAALRALLAARPVYGEGYTTTSAPDETAVAELFARGPGPGAPPADWTHIHQRYAAIPWKKDWVDRDIRGFHYHGGAKPWDMDPEAWPDLSDWWAAAGSLRRKHPRDAGLHALLAPPAERRPPSADAPPAAPAGLEAGPAAPAPAAPVAALDADEAQLQITDAVRSLIMACAPADAGPAPRARGRPADRQAALRREADSIVERWLMALVNEPAPEGSRAPWARVYRRSTLEDDFNNKLAGELIEKKFAKGPTEAGRLVVSILGLVDRRLDAPPRPTGWVAACDGAELRYGTFRAPRTPRLSRLVGLGGCDAAVAVALRYAVVVSTGQQWGLPQAHVDVLYREFGVRGEAFASPLNARLFGKPGAVFCSVFPDTDGPFGSVGDFFGLPLAELRARSWVVNPPFVEELLGRAARRVVESLEGPDDPAGEAPRRPQTFFFITPAWTDSEAYKLLHGCPALVAEERLAPGEYAYENPAGGRVATRAASIYFALSTEAPAVRARLAGALRTAIA
jgi:hypothetical protein